MSPTDLGDGAWLTLHTDVWPGDAALLEALVAELPLRQETVRVAGRTWPTPRLVSWHGDPGCSYGYSGRVFEPSPWTPGLAAVRERLAERAGARFNSALANLYRDGADAMGAHSDDEPELGPAAPDDVLIASVSLGATRRFVLAHKRDRARKVDLSLPGGSLLVMGGSTQRWWRHRVPRTRRMVGPRLNLTFRLVRRPAGPMPGPA